jgi:hypothetical protein
MVSKKVLFWLGSPISIILGAYLMNLGCQGTGIACILTIIGAILIIVGAVVLAKLLRGTSDSFFKGI